MQEQSRLQQLLKAAMRKNRIRRAIAILSCFVLLLTLNQLKFEADALQRIPACNLREHAHTASCYQDGELICGLPEHEHSDACYQQRPVQPEPTVFDEFAEINSQVVLASPMEEEVDVDISADSVDEVVGETTLDLDTDGSAAGVYAEAGSDDNGVEVEYDLDDLYDENGDETVIADDNIENDAVDAGKDADETVAEYSLNGGSVAFLSDILRAVGINASGITDVGEITDEIKPFIRDANYLVIESNHDEEMLSGGPYPAHLKRRIASNTGHLSNSDCGKALAENATQKLRHVWLCHLSEENNHPELARKTVDSVLRSYGIVPGTDFQLSVLKRKLPCDIVDLV